MISRRSTCSKSEWNASTFTLSSRVLYLFLSLMQIIYCLVSFERIFLQSSLLSIIDEMDWVTSFSGFVCNGDLYRFVLRNFMLNCRSLLPCAEKRMVCLSFVVIDDFKSSETHVPSFISLSRSNVSELIHFATASMAINRPGVATRYLLLFKGFLLLLPYDPSHSIDRNGADV